MNASRHLEFRSPLPPSVCIERLKNSIDPDRTIGRFLHPRKSGFSGKVEHDSFYLRTSASSNPATLLTFQGRLIPDGSGTHLSGTFQITRYLYLYLPVIFGPILVMDVKAFVLGLPQGALSLIGLIASNALFLLIIAGLIHYRYHHYYPSSEEESLRRFLINTLKVDEADVLSPRERHTTRTQARKY